MFKVITVVGARPQFIKAATVSRAFSRFPEQISEKILHSGQHYDENMSDVFFSEMGIPRPVFQLSAGGGFHGEQTGKMLAGIEEILLAEKPDCVLVYGDTNSTLAGALAAAKLHIPVAHVEAGLRSYNKKMPEEINRIATDHISSLLFAPTDTAYETMQKENLDPESMFLSGDVMYDAALYYSKKADAQSTILDQCDVESKSYILATIHRAETTDNTQRINAIVEALVELGKKEKIVLPLHPRTRNTLDSLGILNKLSKAVLLTDPLGFIDMVMLEKHAKLIVTDSGGVQKEAYFHKVPCVTLRTETEWSELVDAGWNILADLTDGSTILESIYKGPTLSGSDISCYGTGDASGYIAEKVLEFLRG